MDIATFVYINCKYMPEIKAIVQKLSALRFLEWFFILVTFGNIYFFMLSEIREAMHIPSKFQVNWTCSLISVARWNWILNIFTPIYFFQKLNRYSKNHQNFNPNSYFKAQIYEILTFVLVFSKSLSDEL